GACGLRRWLRRARQLASACRVDQSICTPRRYTQSGGCQNWFPSPETSVSDSLHLQQIGGSRHVERNSGGDDDAVAIARQLALYDHSFGAIHHLVVVGAMGDQLRHHSPNESKLSICACLVGEREDRHLRAL